MASPSEILDANRAFFGNQGRKLMQSDLIKHITARSVQAIKEAANLTPDTVALDFACGAGKVSEMLIQDCKSIVGLDITPGLVEDFNASASSMGISDRMYAKCVDITENPDALEGKTFDLIYCVLSYHHFPSANAVTRALAKLLKPGGELVIIDGIKGDEDPEHGVFGGAPMPEVGHAIPHKQGYERDEVGELYASAGLKMAKFSKSFDYEIFGNTISTFIAVGGH